MMALANPATPGKRPYPFDWPGYVPGREGGKPGRKPKPRRTPRRALTAPARPAHNACALDASGAGRENPLTQRRTKRQGRALFLCPAFFYGGWCWAGFGLAGSFVPVSHPSISRRPSP